MTVSCCKCSCFTLRLWSNADAITSNECDLPDAKLLDIAVDDEDEEEEAERAECGMERANALLSLLLFSYSW